MPENISNTEYEKLISKTIDIKENKSKSIVEGKIVAIENDMVIVDVGLKSEGRIPINEFSRPGIKPEIETGQKLNVYIENVDSINGETKLSREKAVKQKAWNFLQDCYENNKVVSGTPYNRVKGGMSVDLDGVTAFLPGSQIDTRQIIKEKEILFDEVGSVIHNIPFPQFDKPSLQTARVEGMATQFGTERIYYDAFIVLDRKAGGYLLCESRSSILNGMVEGPYFEEVIKSIEIKHS